MRWRCDADADCMDGTDEEDCGTGGKGSAAPLLLPPLLVVPAPPPRAPYPCGVVARPVMGLLSARAAAVGLAAAVQEQYRLAIAAGSCQMPDLPSVLVPAPLSACSSSGAGGSDMYAAPSGSPAVLEAGVAAPGHCQLMCGFLPAPSCPAVRTCPLDEFQCNNTLCKPLAWKCDGEDDCGDNSDENPEECCE